MDSTTPPSPTTAAAKKRGSSSKSGFFGRLMAGSRRRSSNNKRNINTDSMVGEPSSSAHMNNDSQRMDGSSRRWRPSSGPKQHARHRGHNAVFMSVTPQGNQEYHSSGAMTDNSARAAAVAGGGGGAGRRGSATRRSMTSIASIANGNIDTSSTTSYQDYCFSETIGMESSSTDFVNSTGSHSYTPWKQMWM